MHTAGLGGLDMETQDEQDSVWIRDDVQVRTGLPMNLVCAHNGMGLEGVMRSLKTPIRLGAPHNTPDSSRAVQVKFHRPGPGIGGLQLHRPALTTPANSISPVSLPPLPHPLPFLQH